MQAAGFQSGQCNPARNEDAQYVPVREDERIALQRTNPSNNTIRAHTHFHQSFPTRATVIEQTPAGVLGPNVLRSPTLVCAIVPFHQIGIGLHALTETCQISSPPCPLQRTGEYFGKAQAAQARA